MKSQKHNQGELKTLNVEIEKSVVEVIEQMSENTKIPLADIVVIALKRFRAHHADYEGVPPKAE